MGGKDMMAYLKDYSYNYMFPILVHKTQLQIMQQEGKEMSKEEAEKVTKFGLELMSGLLEKMVNGPKK